MGLVSFSNQGNCHHHDATNLVMPSDCPQVQAVYDYEAQQPDELGLMCGDVVKVFRKMADGKNPF